MIRVDAFGWIVGAWLHRGWTRGFTRWDSAAHGGFSCYAGWLTVSAARRQR